MFTGNVVSCDKELKMRVKILWKNYSNLLSYDGPHDIKSRLWEDFADHILLKNKRKKVNNKYDNNIVYIVTNWMM